MIVTKELLEKQIAALTAEAESHLARANQLIGARIQAQGLLSVLKQPDPTETSGDPAGSEPD